MLYFNGKKIKMNFFSKIIAKIYRAYEDKGAHSPYFDAILTIVLILFFHAVHIGLILNIPSYYIMPWSSTDSKSNQWLYASLYFGVIIVFIAIIFKKSKLDKIEVSQKAIDKTRKVLPIYLACCLILLFFLLIKSGMEKGKINF